MKIRNILAASAVALAIAGCKVEMTVPEGGRVVIEYFSHEDLDRLLTRLGVSSV